MANPNSSRKANRLIGNSPSPKEPKRGMGERMAVQRPGNGQSLTHPAGTGTEGFPSLPPAPDRFPALDGINPSDKDCRRISNRARHHVQAPVNAIAPVDVCRSRPSEHAVVPPGPPDPLGGVGRRIVGPRIGLRLHYDPTDHLPIHLRPEDAAQKAPGGRAGLLPEEIRRKEALLLLPKRRTPRAYRGVLPFLWIKDRGTPGIEGLPEPGHYQEPV